MTTQNPSEVKTLNPSIRNTKYIFSRLKKIQLEALRDGEGCNIFFDTSILIENYNRSVLKYLNERDFEDRYFLDSISYFNYNLVKKISELGSIFVTPGVSLEYLNGLKVMEKVSKIWLSDESVPREIVGSLDRTIESSRSLIGSVEIFDVLRYLRNSFVLSGDGRSFPLGDSVLEVVSRATKINKKNVSETDVLQVGAAMELTRLEGGYNTNVSRDVRDFRVVYRLFQELYLDCGFSPETFSRHSVLLQHSSRAGGLEVLTFDLK